MRIRRMSLLGLAVLALLSGAMVGIGLAHAQTPLPPRTFLPLVANSCAAVALLEDGGFEAGLPNPYWQTVSNVSSDVLDDSSVPAPQSGEWKAWMGGDDLVQESLWQVINVPAGVQGLRVSYWWRVDTFETNHPFDTLEVQIRDGAGNPLQTLETLTDGDASANWQQSTFTLSGYGGQTIQLAFVAQTDGTDPTSFFIDDVSVFKACPAGLPGDVTGDCQVTVLDIQDTATHWRETVASACYAPPYDLDNNSRIDIVDIQRVASGFGQTVSLRGEAQ